MPKFANNIDLLRNELRNARVQNLSAAPSTPVAGQVYFDTTQNKFGVYNGTTWEYMGTSAATGDVTGPAASVDSEVAIFSGTTGKTIKRATGSGLAKLTNGVLSTGVAGTDFVGPTTGSAIQKANGAGGLTAAASGTDFVGPTTGTAVQKANGSGGLTAATAGTDFSTPSSTETVTNKSINASNNTITNLATTHLAAGVLNTSASLASASDTQLPSALATKTYVDNSVQGLSWKTAARVATTANVATLAGGAPNTVDGVTLVAGDRILVKDQTTQSQNGIYTVTTPGTGANGTWTRATDADAANELVNATVFVSEGTANADRVWTQTANAPITVGTTNLVFVEVNGGTVPTATTTTSGRVQLATTAETTTKTDPNKAVTPSGLASFTRTFNQLIGDGAATSITVTHNLNNQWVHVQVFDASSLEMVIPDVTLNGVNTCLITFATAPTANQYRVVIVG